MNISNDTRALDLWEAAARIRDGKFSSAELTKQCLGRIAAHDGRLGAFSETFADRAMGIARARDAEARAGSVLGPLHGVPVAVKDLIDVEGHVTAAGSLTRKGREAAASSATVVRRLTAAGAVIVGKTTLVEFAFGGWGTNQGWGTPCNPWDLKEHRSPGGSSSGSAVAVAAGMALGAIGTDTGGSVRIPSAFCGLTGLKVTEGRVSNAGMAFVSRTLDTAGPMAWSARDLALLLDAIHGPDPLDPKTFGAQPETFAAGLDSLPANLRIAVPRTEDLGVTDPAVMPAFQNALDALRDAGTRSFEMDRRMDFAAEQEATGTIIASEAYAECGMDAESEIPGDPASRARILKGATIPAHHYAIALAQRKIRQAEFLRRFEAFDLIALPTLPISARPVATLDESDLSPSRLTRFASYFGLCAIAVPCGFDEAGLPLSTQLVAAPYRERLLLAAAHAIQQRTDWHRARPSGLA